MCYYTCGMLYGCLHWWNSISWICTRYNLYTVFPSMKVMFSLWNGNFGSNTHFCFLFQNPSHKFLYLDVTMTCKSMSCRKIRNIKKETATQLICTRFEGCPVKSNLFFFSGEHPEKSRVSYVLVNQKKFRWAPWKNLGRFYRVDFTGYFSIFSQLDPKLRINLKL